MPFMIVNFKSIFKANASNISQRIISQNKFEFAVILLISSLSDDFNLFSLVLINELIKFSSKLTF